MTDTPIYRPLNVRDALSYLDQVKLRFQDKPEVYNRFLDVMKEFKGQIIDTPGVIDRVSTLFRGHPSLIQGFNTFLPPGYRIECHGADGDVEGLITVTTPSGTVSQMPAGGFAAAIDQLAEQSGAAGGDRSRRTSPTRFGQTAPAPAAAPAQSLPPLHSQLGTGSTYRPPSSRPGYRSGTTPPPPAAAASNAVNASNRPAPPNGSAAPGPLSIPASSGNPTAPSGPSTPSAAQFLASGLGGHGASGPASAQNRGGGPMVEFNHAIAFVNKIKQRFSDDQDTYKQFLEILQTYQRDTRDIQEVYEQVTKLFNNAPDLIDEFKKFLPEHGGGGLGGMGFGSFVQAASGQPAGSAEKLSQKRGSKDGKELSAQKRRRQGPDGKSSSRKKHQKAESPDGDDGDATLTLPPGAPQTLASPEEVAFFDKVKKYVDDKVTYHEFLKLLNLFVQDFIDVRTLVERAESFIGNSTDVWPIFKKMVEADKVEKQGLNAMGPQGGYGFGGMIQADSQVVENVPMLERVKPDLSGPKVKSYGPSYRKLPKTEINLQCTGRDAMCWDVLNDEWVSHPTWAAEDAAPFMAHKKNAYEEALHKSEEERHEYDYHIEANLRTIALLEPLNNKIQTMDPEERQHFNLKAGLGGQSKSIYQRIIKKVYGKELGPDVIRALHENPVVALPIVLERLKAKDEEWKKAQREWNRVWREQDAKNFYKALDHQGVAFKASDKKVLSAKSLIAEIEARRREQQNVRSSLLDHSSFRAKPQFSFSFSDVEVVKDVIKLVISYLDRMSTTLSASDKDRIERQLRDFIPLLFMLDKDEFDAEFGDAEHSGEEADASDESDGDVTMGDEDETGSAVVSRRGKKDNAGSDLRKKLLKQAGEKEGREMRASTMTPGPDDPEAETSRSIAEGTPMTENGDRAETPVPAPADPEAVAEAVEKDKATADASEQTWVQIDSPSGSRQSSEESDAPMEEQVTKSKPHRKANFFANNQFYVLIRLFEIMYSRLKKCKSIAEELAKEKKQPINPIAVKLGLADPESQNFGIEGGDNPAEFYYTNLLGLAERLFENDLDIGTFEETLRFMFGTKAYTMFTLDRVIAAIVKHTQTTIGDMKSQELFALLQRDRAGDKTTTRQQIAYRSQAETVLASDDSLYKVEFHHEDNSITIQLLGREDLTIDDAETAQEKWKQYIESFVMIHPTEGLEHRVDQPFLRRMVKDSDIDIPLRAVDTSSGLEIKIALGNYRMFFTPETEDYYHRKRSKAELAKSESSAKELSDSAKTRLKSFVDKRMAGEDASSAPQVVEAAGGAEAAVETKEDKDETMAVDEEKKEEAAPVVEVPSVPAA